MSGVVAISGSGRNGSVNRKLLGLARAQLHEHGVDSTEVDLRQLELPIYDGDLEEHDGQPGAVDVLRNAIRNADGLLIASPEYNHSLAPLLKNAIDWVSHPIEDQPFKGKPVAIMSAAARPWGGTRMLPHLRDVLVDLGCVVTTQSVAVPVSHQAFDADDRLIADASSTFLARAMAELATEIRLRAPMRAVPLRQHA